MFKKLNRQWAAAAARQGATMRVWTEVEMGSSQFEFIADEDELSEAVWATVGKRLRWRQPIITLSTIDEESDLGTVEIWDNARNPCSLVIVT